MALCKKCRHRYAPQGGDGECPLGGGGWIPAKESGITYCPAAFAYDPLWHSSGAPKKKPPRTRVPAWLQAALEDGKARFV